MDEFLQITIFKERVSVKSSVYAKWAIFELCCGENKLHLNEMTMRSALY
jgi:hypothetical protein